MKGIILAGGSGTRLYPLTIALSKQLLPVYDKPLIYYPLSVLMMADIRDILIITTPHDQPAFKALLGGGERLGIRLEYAIQDAPRGLAEAFVIAEILLAMTVLSWFSAITFSTATDCQVYSTPLRRKLRGATIFAYVVSDPERYGVVELDAERRPVSIIEKPSEPRSNFAVTGLYFYDNEVLDIATTIRPSGRGELEITDINRIYMERRNLHVEIMGRGFAWLDTGTHDTLLEASNFVEILERRQGLKMCCPEEIAYSKGLIDQAQLLDCARRYGKSSYGAYLRSLMPGDQGSS